MLGIAFLGNEDSPLIAHHDIRQLAVLNHAALQLEYSPLRQLYLEAFLIPLLVALDRPPEGVSQDAPAWLIAACASAQNVKVFRKGAAGFVAATGRAHPHVSRCMRRFLVVTPSGYINTQRMGYAACRLIGTSDPLAEIAADCGLLNLSHFHKLFLAAHGEAPLRYRLARQQNLIQPRS